MTESRVLIIACSDEYHPLETLGEMMELWLKDAGMQRVTLCKGREAITQSLDEYDMLILALTPYKFSSAEEDALVSFVTDGKKLMAIHTATAVDAENEKYVEMVGGRFVTHSPHQEFTVNVAEPGHPVVEGVKDFKITDELYVLDRTPSAAHVLLTATWDGKAQPMLYTRAHGRGKVLYNALGHGPDAYENPNLEKLIVQGTQWLLS